MRLVNRDWPVDSQSQSDSERDPGQDSIVERLNNEGELRNWLHVALTELELEARTKSSATILGGEPIELWVRTFHDPITVDVKPIDVRAGDDSE